jgi:hypothetical protein
MKHTDSWSLHHKSVRLDLFVEYKFSSSFTHLPVDIIKSFEDNTNDCSVSGLLKSTSRDSMTM